MRPPDPPLTSIPSSSLLEKAGALLHVCPSGREDKMIPLLPAEETSVPGVYGGTALTSFETKQERIMLEDHFTSSFPVKSS